MKVNGVAIYGTMQSPLPVPPAWGRVTQKGEILYLHVFDWPADGRLLVPGLRNEVVSAAVLADGSKLKSFSTAAGVVVEVPMTAPGKFSSTLVLKIKGAPAVQ